MIVKPSLTRDESHNQLELTEEKSDIFSKHERPLHPEKRLCQSKEGHIDSQKVEI